MEAPKKLTVCSVTWNIKGETPTDASIELVFHQYKVKDYDIYVIATQECLRGLVMSIFFWEKSTWENLLLHYFNSGNKTQYYKVQSSTLSAMNLLILAKVSLKDFITNTGSSSIKTGGYKLLGNKGASYLWLKYNNIPMAFINCHLAAYRDYQDKRNESFEYILDQFAISQSDKFFLGENAKNKEPVPSKGKECLNKFSFCMFLGDLNSRNNCNLKMIKEYLEKGNTEEMLKNDQLNIAIKEGKIDINGFVEQPIKFYPTYRYITGEIAKYVMDLDEHVPSYTDRIFYRVSSNSKIKINPGNYTAINQVTISDHKPVFFDFELVFE